jgi:asparagine synthase (glutamine-hydrolysing)
MAFDTLTYLPGDILVKVDRASMHSSLETRAPFLDTRVIEHSWKIPIMYKVDKKEGKKILKNILENHIPKTLIDRPKQGFSIPIDKWIRGDLRDWASSMLTHEKTYHIGIFKPDVVDAILQDHLAGKKNFGQQLWTILMTHMWFDSNFSKDL